MFTAGVITASQAAALNELERKVNALMRFNVIPPLTIDQSGGAVSIGIDSGGLNSQWALTTNEGVGSVTATLVNWTSAGSDANGDSITLNEINGGFLQSNTYYYAQQEPDGTWQTYAGLVGAWIRLTGISSATSPYNLYFYSGIECQFNGINTDGVPIYSEKSGGLTFAYPSGNFYLCERNNNPADPSDLTGIGQNSLVVFATYAGTPDSGTYSGINQFVFELVAPAAVGVSGYVTSGNQQFSGIKGMDGLNIWNDGMIQGYHGASGGSMFQIAHGDLDDVQVDDGLILNYYASQGSNPVNQVWFPPDPSGTFQANIWLPLGLGVNQSWGATSDGAMMWEGGVFKGFASYNNPPTQMPYGTLFFYDPLGGNNAPAQNNGISGSQVNYGGGLQALPMGSWNQVLGVNYNEYGRLVPMYTNILTGRGGAINGTILDNSTCLPGQNSVLIGFNSPWNLGNMPGTSSTGSSTHIADISFTGFDASLGALAGAITGTT